MEAAAEGVAGAVAGPGDGASPVGAAEAAAVAAATETTASDGTRYPHQVPTSSPPGQYLNVFTVYVYLFLFLF
jgi:hypothetical protein